MKVMDQPEKASVPPEQTTGFQKDLKEEVSFETVEDAEDMFVIAKERLLEVNEWKEISESINTEFQLVDPHGHPHKRHVRKGDFIRINIPGPDNETRGGDDWVHVEALEYDDYPDESIECIAIRLRPAKNPQSHDTETAHFFDDASTSTFVIERIRNIVEARYHGRNEKLNTGAETFTGKVRNAAVGMTALLGFSDVQWKGLLTGFLKIDD
jgi:hypothetical protein